jgi:hypothetical protein
MTKFVAGGYTATWNALALGQAAQGYRLSHQFFKRIITGDSMAESPQDAVYRGAEMHLQCNLIEYMEAGIATIMWPYGNYLTMGAVGRLDVQAVNNTPSVKQMVFTAVAGTPAATALSPATLTLPKCILAEGFPVELLMAPDLKEVPLRMRIYPSEAGVFGTQT